MWQARRGCSRQTKLARDLRGSLIDAFLLTRRSMQILPQVAWPVAQLTTQSSSSSISAASDAGSDRTSSSSSTSPQRKRNSESRDADEAPPCENASTAASSLLMLFEEEGKPAVAPMPFFQFPRIAPAVLTSAPPVKRTCFSFGKKVPSATMAWPQRSDLSRGDASRGDASRGDCSPRVTTHCRAPPSDLEIKETMRQMVQARLSSGSASGEQLDEPAALTHASRAVQPTPFAA